MLRNSFFKAFLSKLVMNFLFFIKIFKNKVKFLLLAKFSGTLMIFLFNNFENLMSLFLTLREKNNLLEPIKNLAITSFLS